MKVWVDCTAAAHPLVLRPLIEGLRERGHEVEITARELRADRGRARSARARVQLVRRPRRRLAAVKAAALAGRSAALLRWARPRRFDLALAHGSVDLAVVGIAAADPAGADAGLRVRGPAAQARLARGAAGDRPRLRFRSTGSIAAGAREAPKLVRYPGLKEDYYLAGFEPDPAVLAELGLDALGVDADRGRDDERVLVVVRPPPETSAYHADNPLYEAPARPARGRPARRHRADPADRSPARGRRRPRRRRR